MIKPRLSVQGWNCYTDTSVLYRKWHFEEPYEPIGANVGDRLLQDLKGFHVRDSEGSVDSIREIEDYLGEWLIRGYHDATFALVEKAYNAAVEALETAADRLGELGDLAPRLPLNATKAFTDKLEALAKKAPEKPQHEALGAFVDIDFSRGSPDVFLVRTPIPEINADAGDLIAFSYGWGRQAPEVRGRAIPLMPDDHRALRKALDWQAPQLEEITHTKRSFRVSSFGRYIADARIWGLNAKKWRTKVYLVKPFGAEQAVPIAAPTDDGAIFELLAEVGCRMPDRVPPARGGSA